MPNPGLLPPYRSGRSPSGRLRNFAQMGDDKFRTVYAYVRREGNDGEAITAVEAEYVRRWGWGAQGPSGVQGVSGRADDQFISKDEWDRFYATVDVALVGANGDDYCARCGEWAGNHRAEAPPMCPTTKAGSLYSPRDSFATQAWLDGTSDGRGVSTEPQPLSALLEELLG